MLPPLLLCLLLCTPPCFRISSLFLRQSCLYFSRCLLCPEVPSSHSSTHTITTIGSASESVWPLTRVPCRMLPLSHCILGEKEGLPQVWYPPPIREPSLDLLTVSGALPSLPERLWVWEVLQWRRCKLGMNPRYNYYQLRSLRDRGVEESREEKSGKRVSGRQIQWEMLQSKIL